jgi:hypothetical protein
MRLPGSVSGAGARRRRPQRTHNPRRGRFFDGLGWDVRAGSPWRYVPRGLPPWEAAYQQTRRWLSRRRLGGDGPKFAHAPALFEGQSAAEPTAAILGGRALRSTPESGPQGGYDGYHYAFSPVFGCIKLERMYATLMAQSMIELETTTKPQV